MGEVNKRESRQLYLFLALDHVGRNAVISLHDGADIRQGLAEDLIQSPQKTYTKQLVKAASPGWFESLSLDHKKKD